MRTFTYLIWALMEAPELTLTRYTDSGDIRVRADRSGDRWVWSLDKERMVWVLAGKYSSFRGHTQHSYLTFSEDIEYWNRPWRKQFDIFRDYKAIQSFQDWKLNISLSLLTLFMEICPGLTRVWSSPGQVLDTWHVHFQLWWRDNTLYKYWDHILPEVDKGGKVLFCHIQIHDHNLCERVVEGNWIRTDSIYQTLKASFVTFKTSNFVRFQCSSFDKRRVMNNNGFNNYLLILSKFCCYYNYAALLLSAEYEYNSLKRFFRNIKYPRI